MALRIYRSKNKIVYDDDTFDKVLEDSFDKVDVYPAESEEDHDYVLTGPLIGEREITIGQVQDKFGNVYSGSRFVSFYRGETGTHSSINVSSFAGNAPVVGTFGQTIIGYQVRDIAVKWDYQLYDTNYDMLPVDSTGDGSQSFDSGMLVASSASSGTVSLKSRKSTRYRPGNGGFAWFTGLMDSGSGSVYAGLESDNGDKVVIRRINGDVSFGYEDSDGEVDYVPASDFNGDVDPVDVVWDNLNIFQIRYGYLGTANIEIFIHRDGKIQLLHRMELAGELTSPHVRFPQFRMVVYAQNGGVIKTGSWAAGTFSNVLESRGEDPSARPVFHRIQREVEPSATPSPIVAYRSKDLYNGFLHAVTAKLLVAKIASNSEGLYEIDFIFNATTITGGSWTDINTLSSVIEVNTGVTGYTGGQSVYGSFLAVPSQGTGTISVSEDFEKLGVFLNRSESVVVTIREVIGGGGSDQQLLNFSWQELF